jgi:diguanylate cyclase (GGDEF)-like protein
VERKPIEKEELSKLDRIRFQVLSWSLGIGTGAFITAFFLNRPGGIIGHHFQITFPLMAAIAFSFLVWVRRSPSSLNRVSRFTFFVYTTFFAVELAFGCFVLAPLGVEIRLYMHPVSPWIGMMVVLAFTFFERAEAIKLSALYTLVLMSIVSAFLIKNHGAIESTLQNGLLQEYFIGNACYIAVMMSIGRIKEIYLESKLSEYKMQQLAFTDELTKLPNRRAMIEFTNRELSRFRRYGTLMGVILMDLDHFKKFNDQFGHDKGDLVLKESAKAISGLVRETDWFGRWGGEEFLVVVGAASPEGVGIFANRLRAALEEIKIPGLPQVTGSFGVAIARSEDDIDTLVKRADEALYAAKAAGRNRVMLAPALSRMAA